MRRPAPQTLIRPQTEERDQGSGKEFSKSGGLACHSGVGQTVIGVMEHRTSSHTCDTPYRAHGWHSARDGRRFATTSSGRCRFLFKRIKRKLLSAPWAAKVSHSGWACSAHPCQRREVAPKFGLKRILTRESTK